MVEKDELDGDVAKFVGINRRAYRSRETPDAAFGVEFEKGRRTSDSFPVLIKGVYWI